MNIFKRLLILFMCIGLVSGSVYAKTPRVDKRISNVYLQPFKNEGFSYLVDPYAQLCFILTGYGGVTEIACEKLKKRPEWQEIIYWES